MTTDDLEDGALVDDLEDRSVGNVGDEVAHDAERQEEDGQWEEGDDPFDEETPTMGHSTPEEPADAPTLDLSPVRRWRGLSVGRFEFLPMARNIPDELLSLQVAPPVEESPRISGKWRAVPPCA